MPRIWRRRLPSPRASLWRSRRPSRWGRSSGSPACRPPPCRPRSRHRGRPERDRHSVMVKKILAVAVVIIFGLVAVVATRPAQFHIARTTTITAPAPVVFAQVNDFHKWEAWNPWAKLDPAAKQTYEGAPVGAGAIYTWSGNSEVGAGRMTIVESHPSDRIRINLEFLKPIAGTSTAEFTF